MPTLNAAGTETSTYVQSLREFAQTTTVLGVAIIVPICGDFMFLSDTERDHVNEAELNPTENHGYARPQGADGKARGHGGAGGFVSSHGEQPLSGCPSWEPFCASGEYGICEDDELSGAGNQRKLMGLSSIGQAFVEGDQLGVPAECSRQGGGIDAFAQTISAACDMPFALAITAVVNKRRQACERCGLLARQSAELWHPDDESKRGARADPVDGADECKAPGEIFMGTQAIPACNHFGPTGLEPPMSAA